MMRPGLYEYQSPAKMVEVHAMGGSEAEGYAPIVGAGPNSTALHYDKLARKVAMATSSFSMLARNFPATPPTSRAPFPQTESSRRASAKIYDIVFGAQKAVFAALKPGMNFCKSGDNSLYKISYDYINSTARICM